MTLVEIARIAETLQRRRRVFIVVFSRRPNVCSERPLLSRKMIDEK